MSESKMTWEVWEGHASWHQKRAGNYLGAAVTTGFESREAAEMFAAKLNERGIKTSVLPNRQELCSVCRRVHGREVIHPCE